MNDQEQKELIIETEAYIAQIENDLSIGWSVDAFPCKLAKIALAALKAEPVKLPNVTHPAQFDYADKVAEVLKANGIKVVGYDDE